MSPIELRVTAAGWLSTFQDLGRADTERLGVPTGGAADQYSATVANLLVGNARGATLIESLGGEFAFVPDAAVLVAVTGAPARVTVADAPVDGWAPVVVPAGHELRVRDIRVGARIYVAVNGALVAETFLGSSAPDARMGFEQKVIRGAVLSVRSRFRTFPRYSFGHPLFRLRTPRLRLAEGPWDIDVVESRATNTVPGLRDLIAESTYTVTDRSNHVGLRLSGPVLHPDGDAEIVSHGVPIGALEIPHADELIVLGRYRSLTAGYPIVGFASRASLSLLGQAGPGRELRFRWVDREAAVRRHAQRERELLALERTAGAAFEARGFTPGPLPGSRTTKESER
ncbi:biotin-dependent carboxyltransferase family protein [Tsukamurella soli]|uniref:Biotin-dependent carboxyltransferase family protein n=1 Tax=Tsukamurella soli TaxID=644556 RepID=A0ABP8J8P2_9ACTN